MNWIIRFFCKHWKYKINKYTALCVLSTLAPAEFEEITEIYGAYIGRYPHFKKEIIE